MNPTPENDAADPAGLRADLSALMDGQADATEVQRCTARWRDDPDARSTWHAYHLIGDLLRSDELASSAARDAAFLAALRQRLTSEPTVLAPAALAGATLAAGGSVAPARRRQAWLVPAAVAAGFVAVAGVLVVTRMSAPEPAGASVLAVRAPASADLQRVGTAPAPAPAPAPVQPVQPVLLDGQLIRDAQLDAYLRAHREMRGSAAAAVPGGAMRSVETIAPQR